MANLMQSGVASAERVFEVLDAPEQVTEAPARVEVDDAHGRVAFDDVSFSYDPGTPLIEHLDLQVEPGQTVAIVGPTGAGKTRPNAEAKAPVNMAQSMGLVATPRKALRAACAGLTRCSSSPAVVPSPPRRDSAMHSELVTTRSTAMVTIAGPAALAPSSATKSGTPM